MKLNIDKNKAQADPFVIKEDGKYYLYCSGAKGVDLYVSTDRYNFDYVGICFSKPGMKEYWAPSVIKIDDKFYMYVSYMKEEDEDVHTEHLIVASSSTPEGPFKYIKNLTPPFSIDSHVVKSGNDLFMFYSINDYEAERAGTLIVVDKMLSPTKMAKKPKVVVRPTLDEEIFQKNRFKEGQHWHTLEGAFYFYKDGYHYVMYSGNCYQNENYYIGYAYCESDELDLTKLEFKKYPDENTYHPLICKNMFEEGTGHNSLLEEDGHYYVFYHGRDFIFSRNDALRTARSLEISVNKEKLSIIKR